MFEAGKYEQVSLLFDKLSQQLRRAVPVIEKLQSSSNSQQNHKQSIDGRDLPQYYIKQLMGTSIVYNSDEGGVRFYFTIPALTRERYHAK
ncbi:hypothetical protein [Glaciecola sp. SC05]|uniref:hypothetical protein n=1 Tax=Glaciecola sp. SC05 TaxID=1987355 RepID=UPI00352919FE